MFLKCILSPAIGIYLPPLGDKQGLNSNRLYILGVSQAALTKNLEEDMSCLLLDFLGMLLKKVLTSQERKFIKMIYVY